MTLALTQMKSFSYAVNRAKKVFKKHAKIKLNDYIIDGKLRIRAGFQEIKSSQECYRFSLHQGPFLQKQFADRTEPSPDEIERRERQAREDRIAYDIAYNTGKDGPPPEGTKLHRGTSQIIVWRNLDLMEELENADLRMSPEEDYEDLVDYVAEIDFDPSFDNITFKRIQMFESGHMKLSRYRSSDMLTVTYAENLTCYASDVEKCFPHKEEYRSDQPAHRPPAFDSEKLFAFLDSIFDQNEDRLEERGFLVKIIEDFEKNNSSTPDGASKSTIYNYCEKYKKYRKGRAGK